MKINRHNNPGVVAGELLHDWGISLSAKGLYALLESNKGEIDFDEFILNFKKHSTPKQYKAFQSALAELKDSGHIVIS